MGVDHYMMLGSPPYHIIIVVDYALAVVMLTYRKDVAHVTRLYRIVSIFVHKAESLGDPSLVIGCG